MANYNPDDLLHSELLEAGEVKNQHAKVIRIVHISDTHMNHIQYLPLIPEGDILIHSGDFFNFYDGPHFSDRKENLEYAMKTIDSFFMKLPHKHKIFVAGNHDKYLENFEPDTIDFQLPHGIYLCDRMVKLCGLKIYGTPWNNSLDMSFYKKNLEEVWEKVPPNLDILVTHIPPFGICDYGNNKYWDGTMWECDLCTKANPGNKRIHHGSYAHQGCREMRDAIFTRIRPKVHLFGHVHNKYGTVEQDGILFCNGALPCSKGPLVIDYYSYRPQKSLFSCLSK